MLSLHSSYGEACTTNAQTSSQSLQNQSTALPASSTLSYAAQIVLISELRAAGPEYADSFVSEHVDSFLRLHPKQSGEVAQLLRTHASRNAIFNDTKAMLDTLELGRGRIPLAGRCWVLDAIDDVAAAVAARPFTTSAALFINGKRALAVIAPDTSQRWWDLQAYMETLDRAQGYLALKFRSPHLRYLAVATGTVEAALDLPRPSADKPHIWSHAAGSVIAEEAGAAVGDASDQPLNFLSGRTLSDNSGLMVAAMGLARWRLADAIANTCARGSAGGEGFTSRPGSNCSSLHSVEATKGIKADKQS